MPGTLAFVDVTGFTQLTERLAKHGKVGAEEVSETLDGCFTRLLSAAYDDGAGLVKWGGDAALLLFTGDEHSARACRAAYGMQRALRAMGALQTSAGRVRLRMSIGVHSGRFQFFLVGDVFRELVITGPDATTVVEVEALASPGEVAVSAAVAGALDPSILGRTIGDAALLKRAPEIDAGPAAPAAKEADVDVSACLPPAIRDHVVGGAHEPEHRPVAVAFVEFSRTDEFLSRFGAAALAEALHECIASAQDAARQFAIPFFQTDIGRDGGKIILVAGAPVHRGGDEDRLLRAVRAIMDRPGALPLRAGVAAGRVFAGDIGPPYRRTYTVYGDTVNAAARLMAQAGRGEILASEDVLTRTKSAFELGPARELVVKGKREAITAAPVGRLAAARAERRAGALVGRERELSTLREALERALTGAGGVVEIVGDAGIGKSRLVEALASHAEGAAWFTAICEEYDAEIPYVPLRTLLREALGLPTTAGPKATEERLRRALADAAPALEDWLPLLAIPLELDIPPTTATRLLDERFLNDRLADAVTDLLAGILTTPTVVAVEDAHWMDEASASVVRRLAARAPERPWLILSTRRDSDTGFVAEPGTAVVVEPAPLTAEDARQLVRAATSDSPLAPHTVAALAERAGGNPLFLTELLSAAANTASIEALPDSVEGVLSAQVDRLAPRDRTMLRYASAFGLRFDLDLLIAAVPEESVALDVGVWERLGDFIEPDGAGGFRFRHALIRDAAYEGLPYRRRRGLHARIGEAIEHLDESPDARAELLSLHFFHADRFEAAWRYSRVAAERARSIHAMVEAAGFYERALQAARRLRLAPSIELAQTWEALGDVRQRLGELEAASSAYREARGRLRTIAAAEGRLFLKEAQIRHRLGRYSQGLRWVSRGLRSLENRDDAAARGERARLAVWYAVTRQKQGYPQQTIDWCRRAIEDAEPADARDALAHAYYVLDWALLALGRGDEATHSPRALEMYEELGDLNSQAGVLNNLGGASYFAGRWNEALDLYGRARDAWEAIGDRWSAAFAKSNIGEILLDQGRLDEAEPLLRDALDVWRAARSSSWIASATRKLGRLEVRRGEHDEALALLGEARAGYERDGEHGEVAATDASIAECLVARGDWSDGLELASGALGRADAMEGVFVLLPALHRVRGYAFIAGGRVAEAREALEESLRLARAKAADYEVALTLDALVSVGGDRSDTVALAAERDAILSRLGVVATPRVPSLVPA